MESSAAAAAELGAGGVITSSGEYISALELQELVQHQIPGLSDIIGPIVNMVLKPALDQMMKEVGGSVTDALSSKLDLGIKAKVPAAQSARSRRWCSRSVRRAWPHRCRCRLPRCWMRR